jgi:hypothetical protein
MQCFATGICDGDEPGREDGSDHQAPQAKGTVLEYIILARSTIDTRLTLSKVL